MLYAKSDDDEDSAEEGDEEDVKISDTRYNPRLELGAIFYHEDDEDTTIHTRVCISKIGYVFIVVIVVSLSSMRI